MSFYAASQICRSLSSPESPPPPLVTTTSGHPSVLCVLNLIFCCSWYRKVDILF
ncbi:hypothetical protein Bca101_020065 [Brassica carinata]